MSRLTAGDPVPPDPDPAASPLDTPGEDDGWRGVSPKFVGVELVSSLIGGLVLCAITVPFILLRTWFGWPALAVAVVITIVTLALAPRRVRAIGYRLRADDLVFRRGIMFHRVVSVPYGRMQLIDINRGPVARALGLAELKFVTAAAATGVAIPGLVAADADALRDRLVELAESRRVGL
ncbi:PH domain-containing protein [Herbiconiux sp. VKM Ac-1786]|uniref:PH domain-containing protein n=1 Tax=Herbiconiux sp. VKM Ac-1786 TaxID=2783824 RepID=UPI00188D2A84|nr:PH domain-containing protein [Herbiconiux sp. VKM Ac-1786]MBF4571521.1 PH domain-containing protein [Herbiconiux sp. VKM Ac-1786]